MFRNLGFLALAMAVSGCISQSQIQSKYIKSQNLCRAESTVALESDSNASIGTAFSECMHKAGWNVASPKTGAVTNNPPSGSPSTNPIASAAKPAQPENAALANPPSGAPSVKPSAAVATTAAPVPAPAANVPAAATYQPARPAATTVDPSFGSGAGRQF